MTLKLSDRDLERLLRGSEAELRPPAGLLARLRAELPAELPAPIDPPPGADSPKVLRPAAWWRSPLLSLAASLAVVAGGSLLAYRSFRESAPPGAATLAQPAPDPVVDSVVDESAAAEERRPQPARPEPAPAAPPAKELKKERGAEDLALQPVQPVEIPEDLPAPAGENGEDTVPIRIVSSRLAAPKKAAPPPPATRPAGRVEGGSPGGVPGGTYGGIAGGVPGGTVAAPAPQRLESPGIEGNTVVESSPLAVTTESPLLDLREREDQDFEGPEETRSLEAPAIQGDAVPAARAKAKDDAQAEDAWKAIERALVGGRWPTAEELVAARPQTEIDRLGAAAGSAGFRSGAADPVELLRGQILDFFAKPDKTKKGLLELRRHAVRLAGKNSDDERAAGLLRTLNLAGRLFPD